MPQASSQLTNAYPAAHRFSPGGIAGIVAAHVALLILLTSLNIVPLPTPLATLMVQIIPATPETSPPRPRPAEPKVTPQPKRLPLQQPQRLAAQSEAAKSDSEAPVVQNTPPAPPAPAATLTQARFDADYLQNPPPAYPAISRRLGEEGRVVLRVYVEPSGRPTQIEIKTSSGSPRLDQSALEAVARWKFIPARRGDEVVGAWVQVPIFFNLKN
jgi:protein TonB